MSLSTGTRLGPYEVLAPLGAGGMGEVYRARDTRLEREVAIKVLPAELASDAERLKRFEKEARSASALNHPNIVTIYDIGSADGISYIAMERVEGSTLREQLAGGALPVKKLLPIATQMAEGLTKAHEAGIVHRDLKPENVMVTKDGLVKILDFGLAKLTSTLSGSGEGSNLPTMTGTTPGMVVGTVGYMSPEQASGGALDFRSDQFALGSILYEMATGKRAFQKKTAIDTLAAILNEEPEPIAGLNPQVPLPLRWIAERCLSKEAENRYAATRDLARDLVTVRDRLSEASLSQPEIAARPRRRGRAAVTVLLLCLAALAGVFALGRRTADRPIPSFQRLTSRRGAVSSARFSSDGQTVVYAAAWEGAPVRLFSTRRDSRDSISLDLPDAGLASLSTAGEMAILLSRPHQAGGWAGTLARVSMTGGAPREVLENVSWADWSPDGRSLAVVRRTGDRWSLEFPAGKVLFQTGGPLRSPRVAPSGDRVAFVTAAPDNSMAVAVVDLEGRMTILSQGWKWGGFGLVWSPGGDEVWFTATEAGWFTPLRAVSLSSKERVLMRIPAWVTVCDVARDGRLLASIGSSRASMYALAPGETRERDLSWHEGPFLRDLSPDGRLVLFDEAAEEKPGSNVVYLRPTDGSPAKRLGEGVAVGLSADGRWALSTTENATRLTLLPTGAGQPIMLPKQEMTYEFASLLPDGKKLLVTASEKHRPLRTYVQDVAGGPARPVTPEGIACYATSLDGRWTVCDEPDGGRSLFDLTLGEQQNRGRIQGLEPGEDVIQFSPDGRSLFVERVGVLPLRVFRVDPVSGKRELLREINTIDPAALSTADVRVTPDGKYYAYMHWHTPSDLFLIEGVR